MTTTRRVQDLRREDRFELDGRTYTVDYTIEYSGPGWTLVGTLEGPEFTLNTIDHLDLAEDSDA